MTTVAQVDRGAVGKDAGIPAKITTFRRLGKTCLLTKNLRV